MAAPTKVAVTKWRPTVPAAQMASQTSWYLSLLKSMRVPASFRDWVPARPERSGRLRQRKQPIAQNAHSCNPSQVLSL